MNVFAAFGAYFWYYQKWAVRHNGDVKLRWSVRKLPGPLALTFQSKLPNSCNAFHDERHRVADDYGVWGPKTYMGKTYEAVERSTFVIDTDGTVKRVMRKVKPATHADDVLAALRA